MLGGVFPIIRVIAAVIRAPPTPPRMPVVRTRRQHAPGEGEQQGPLVDALLGQRCERRARVLRGGGGGSGVAGSWVCGRMWAGGRGPGPGIGLPRPAGKPRVHVARSLRAAAPGESTAIRYYIYYILYIAGVVTPRRGPGQRWEASPLAASQESGAEALRVSRCLRSASESLAASAPPPSLSLPPLRLRVSRCLRSASPLRASSSSQ
jgi:hypothetical protein